MIRRLIREFCKDRRGAVAVEMAVTIPVLAGLLLAGVEVTRFVMLNQKLERASATMADLVSQAEALTEGDLANLFVATGYVVEPFDLAGDGHIIVSSITKPNGANATVNWQREFGAGSGSSSFGSEGNDAVLPAGFVLRDGESIVVGEAFYDFVPTFSGNLLTAVTLDTRSVVRPRFGSLNSLH